MEPLRPWIAISVTLSVFLTLQLRRNTPTDLLFLGGLVALTLIGVVTPEAALAGFSNPAVLTIAGLLAVSTGLRNTGVLDWVGHRLLGNVSQAGPALRRLAVTLVGASAFVLNTALVAMMLPVVVHWCRQRNISPSRMLIPVSYLTILGGVCTLIGTSTTLVVDARLKEEYRYRVNQVDPVGRDARADARAADFQQRFADAVAPMGLFEIGWVGLPCALAGTVVLLLLWRHLLPDRTDVIEQLGEQCREYLVEMLVQNNCRLIDQSVEAAGLRQLPGLFLIEIDRHGDVITPVTPQDVIRPGDRLIFTGVVTTIVDLEKIPGLVPAADLTFELHPSERHQRRLTEVVLSRTSPLIGTTVREANFRQLYNAAVVAVHRNGVRLTNKIGNIRLEPGDTLLLQTRDEFVPTYRNSRDFYLVSDVEGDSPRRHDKAVWAAVLTVVLVGWLIATSFLKAFEIFQGLASTAVAAFTIAGLMIATRCMRLSDARGAIDLQLLLTIAGALGMGRALSDSGADKMVASWTVGLVGNEPYMLLIVIYLLTLVFTELITNAAVAATVLPLAIAVAFEGQHNPRPFIMAVALAASLSFITPIGYQTNLMVMGPGGYRPADYLRAGIPVAAAVTVTALVLIPRVWPLQL